MIYRVEFKYLVRFVQKLDLHRGLVLLVGRASPESSPGFLNENSNTGQFSLALLLKEEQLKFNVSNKLDAFAGYKPLWARG